MYNSLLSHYNLAGIKLPNRIVMAPMTRSMSDNNFCPTLDTVNYYTRRADTGLLITEGTIISPDGRGYPNTPGIYNDLQIESWAKVTESVHNANGRIFMQIWHVGRVSHPIYLNGNLPLAPSPVELKGEIKRLKGFNYGTPRGITVSEIDAVVSDYSIAAVNAIKAGFDGVEIHGANGYLIDQFLHFHTNRRCDEYGGNTKNNCRFALEVIDSVISKIGKDKTAIRLSPGAYLNMEYTEGDTDIFINLLQEIEKREIAYIHLGIFDDKQEFEYLEGTAGRFLRKNYSGTLIGCGSYSPIEADKAIERGDFDLVAIGRPFISNPDLIEKLRHNNPLNVYNPEMLKELI